jgi:glycine hydroxymethyltransferase
MSASAKQSSPSLAKRKWVPAASEALVQSLAGLAAGAASATVAQRIQSLVAENVAIHNKHGINLNPASNVMNPAAEALLSSGLGPRASLGYPGDKYEMGLEAIEEIEVIAAQLAAEIFGAKYAEVRVGSGAMANLYVFMACAKPGDTIIAPPADIGGHVTHHPAGAAGLYGLKVVPAPVYADGFTVDVAALRELALQVKPKVISIGGSLNLFAHPVPQLRGIAAEVGATLMFDAAHLSGMFAGKVWENPLAAGAHVMTMSTYKSLGGPVGGLVLTNDAAIAERIDAIAYPGLTANFDAGRVAALARGLLDWREHGVAYARMMQANAKALANALADLQLPVFAQARGGTTSHQFALEAQTWGGGQAAAKRLLACGIGLPVAPVPGDVNGLRLGTPEITRLGFEPVHMPGLALLIADALAAETPAQVKKLAKQVAQLRQRFTGFRFIVA